MNMEYSNRDLAIQDVQKWLRTKTHGPKPRRVNYGNTGSSGFRHVYKRPNGRYEARVSMDGKAHSLGTFDTAQAAFEVAEAFIRENGLPNG